MIVIKAQLLLDPFINNWFGLISYILFQLTHLRCGCSFAFFSFWDRYHNEYLWFLRESFDFVRKLFIRINKLFDRLGVVPNEEPVFVVFTIFVLRIFAIVICPNHDNHGICVRTHEIIEFLTIPDWSPCIVKQASGGHRIIIDFELVSAEVLDDVFGEEIDPVGVRRGVLSKSLLMPFSLTQTCGD
jgi:hypothetical protein